ncbi:MAG: L,D-transpeptidase family protein [Arenicellales bacterium]
MREFTNCSGSAVRVWLCLLGCVLWQPGMAMDQGGMAGTVRAEIQARVAGPKPVVLRGRVAPLAADALRSFYSQRGYAPAWNAGGKLESRSRTLISIIRASRKQGLTPATYHERSIERVLATPYGRDSAARKADVDLLLSDALFGYASDLLYGRAGRSDLKDSAIDAPENIDLVKLVGKTLASGDLRALVRSLAPAPAAYKRLQGALTRLRSLERAEVPLRLPERTLHPGDSGGEVAALRRRLALLGDLPAARNDGSGVVDPPLVSAVEHFQSRHGLEADGVVGPETRAALEVPISKRILQVELNMERWRWLPRDPGDRYLIVNVGGQELDAVENDRRTLHMRVIVGRPFQKTPSFASKITTVVLNPYWEVPHSIAVNEILPTVRRDPGYLDREYMQVLKAPGGGTVDPATINWSKVPARGFPYRFRQDPGPDNALGRIKFLFPNRYNVYLHDTPAKTLFSHARRCFSHGCVRLEKPFELADLLLHDEPGWSLERVDKTLDTEQNFRMQLTRPMPVYLVYWTAWVDAGGTIEFRHDVYGRDGRLESALQPPPS